MRTRSRFQRLRTLIGVAAFTAMTATALAAEQPAASQQQFSKEQREQMAKLHEHMAACLRSSKSIDECRTEMQKECRQTMGEGCPMMHGHDHMHQNRAEQEKKAQPD